MPKPSCRKVPRDDPHEIANVAGSEGIRYMLDASEGIP